MATQFTYSISNDFPPGSGSGEVNSDNLLQEIADSAIVPTVVSIDTDEDLDQVVITFNTDLSGGEESILDGGTTNPAGGLIAAHNSSTISAEVASVVFNLEFDNGNSGAADTIDWNVKQKQRVTLTDNTTLTFISPDGVGNFLLRVLQDATGGRTVTWPGTCLWPNGNAPTLSTTANAIDIVSFYYDGTNYYGVANTGFAAS